MSGMSEAAKRGRRNWSLEDKWRIVGRIASEFAGKSPPSWRRSYWRRLAQRKHPARRVHPFPREWFEAKTQFAVVFVSQ